MTQREERKQERSSGDVRRNRGRDGREPDDGDSRNVAHLGEISSNQGVEKMEELEADLETLGGEARCIGEGARSS